MKMNKSLQEKWEEYLTESNVKFGKYEPFPKKDDKEMLDENVKACKDKYFGRKSTVQESKEVECWSSRSPIYLLSMLPWEGGSAPIFELVPKKDLFQYLQNRFVLDGKYGHDCIWKNLFITCPQDDIQDAYGRSFQQFAKQDEISKLKRLRKDYRARIERKGLTPLDFGYDITSAVDPDKRSSDSDEEDSRQTRSD